MFHLFRRPTHQKYVADQAAEAQLAALEHRAAAEHHAALADMYEQRVDRLQRVLDNAAVATATPWPASSNAA